MKIIRVKYWFLKNRRIFSFAGVLLFFILIYFIASKSNISLIIDSTSLGIIGTLFGALIGGMLSLLGSVWVNTLKVKGQAELKRKNTIYRPLYDELFHIHHSILKDNPYSGRISFEKNVQTIVPSPQYTAWIRIKNDSRFLEVPTNLVTQMENLEEVILDYIALRNRVPDIIQLVLNDTLVSNGLTKSPISNIGSSLARDVLQGDSRAIYKNAMRFGNENNISNDLEVKINNEVLEKCNAYEAINETKKCYKNLLACQKDSIEFLSLLIKIVINKYER